MLLAEGSGFGPSDFMARRTTDLCGIAMTQTTTAV